MIITKELTKAYDRQLVVKDVDLHIQEGEIYGFLGPNGAGKSTVISMLLGLVPPTRGTVKLFGKTLATDYFAIKRRLGVVAEIQHFYGEMTAREYLFFFSDLYGVKNPRVRIGELLERVDLHQVQGLRLRAFSKGMQQKLALVRALVHDPQLLILDEPVSSLDPHGIKQVRDLILEENRRGRTFFLSSHLLSEVERTCTRIGVLHHGVLLTEDSMEGMKKRLSKGVQLQIEVEEVPEDLGEALGKLPFVDSVRFDGRTFTVHSPGQEDHRGEIARVLSAKGCVVLSMTPDELTLEEAFITLTEQNLSLLTGEAVTV